MDTKHTSREDLEASLVLLNQETLQRKSLLRLSSKTSAPRRISLHQSVLTRKNQEQQNPQSRNFDRTAVKNDTSDLDFSMSLLSDLPKFSKMGTMSQDSLDSLNRSNWSLHEMMEDSGATGMILKSDKPWRKANSKLYQEFLEIVQSHASEVQIFDTIADFIQICTDTLDVMRGMQSKVNDTELSSEETSLENERNTWRLIYCLYQNRLASMNYHSDQSDVTQMDTDVNSNVSEKDVITNLLRNEPQVREYQLIIDWLEKNALDQAGILPKIEYFTDKTVAWENTLHQLQNRQSGTSFGSGRPLVTSLDPDAPIREGKPLHDLDKEDDSRLEKRMYIEVRSGRLQRAQELAIHCGQPWRAACLIGWQPHHDPNYQNPLTDTKLPIEGNPNRSLWKLNAWYLSQDNRFGSFHRAIYASLCGNLKQMLGVASSWQDALWAHIKTLMDIEVESELQGIMAKNYVKLPEEYWKSRMSLEDVFGNLQSSLDPSIRKEAIRPDHLIQKYLILDQIPKLMEIIQEWIDDASCPPQFVRFLAHLVLLLRQIGKSCNEEVGNKVLLSYVRVLMQMGDPTLIAFYTASLPQEEQIVNYACYLEGVREFEMRKTCLTAAEDANLNVEAITKLVVENVRNKRAAEVDCELSGKITETDIEKIEALDWLTFYQSQREEVMWQANALIRFFLTCEKIDAARMAFNKVPADSIELIMMENSTMETTTAQIGVTMTNDTMYKASTSIREYLCYKAYLDAMEGFQEWFSHFHQGKPVPLDALPSFATFTEKVAYDHKKAQYEAELDRWKCTMQHHTKAVKQLLFNVLLFPDGGWLSDTRPKNCDERSEHALRQHQLRKLRNLCIPKITLLLLNVMAEMNEHASCVELADTIASEQYKLYQVFSKERIREVYRKICESSVALMDQKKDSWGYPR